MASEQDYYEVLVRTDHPVFNRDYSSSQNVNSPYNSIMNRVMARQLVKIRSLLDEIALNTNPETVTSLMIDDWENQYFGFTKGNLPLSQRVSELLIKFNKRFSMNVGDAIALAQSIVGLTPVITRNIDFDGWVLGTGVLGVSTVISGPTVVGGRGFYLVSFAAPVDTNLQKQLDNALTIIQKAGSRHKITAEVQYWVLGKGVLGISTILLGV